MRERLPILSFPLYWGSLAILRRLMAAGVSGRPFVGCEKGLRRFLARL